MAVEDKYLKEDKDVYMDDFMSGALSVHIGYDYVDSCGSCAFRGTGTYHGHLLTCSNKKLYAALGLKQIASPSSPVLITDNNRICKFYVKD